MMSDWLGLLRDLYGATGGTVPGPAWTATLATIFWMFSHEDVVARTQGPAEGADPDALDRTFKAAFARRLGWTDRQLEEFWNDPRHEFGPDGTPRYDTTSDAWEEMLRRQTR